MTDFDRDDDRIVFDDLFGSFQAVRNASRQVGSDTVITLDANNTIRLEDVRLSSLQSNDFLFV